MRKQALWLSLLLCLGSMGAYPVGLGDIELRSALNEPLDATIQLRSIKPGDVDDMRVQLADRAQFARAGVDRPFILTGLRFTVRETGGGNGEVLVTTREPVTEPFLNFLVDLEWAQGRIIREYTVLLDPPVYGAAISSAVEQAVTTVDRVPETATPEPTVLEDTSVPAAPAVIAPSVTPGSYGPVRSNDTLWSLAAAYRPDDSVTVQQTMMAMLRANPQAFTDNNINNLKAGAVLRIPERSEIVQQSAAQALADVKRQHALWEEYRQSVGAAVASAPAVAPAPAVQQQPAEETAASSEEDMAASETDEAAPALEQPAVDQGAEAMEDEGLLEVVGSGTAEIGAGGGAMSLEGLQRELTLAQEQADIQRRENEELDAKRRTADELIERLQRLVDVKDDEIAELQSRLSEIEAELEQAQREAMQAPPADTATATEEAAVVQPPKPPTFVEKLLAAIPGDPLVLAAGAGGVVLFAILGVLLARRRKSKDEWVDVDVPEEIAETDLAARPTEVPGAAAVGATAAAATTAAAAATAEFSEDETALPEVPAEEAVDDIDIAIEAPALTPEELETVQMASPAEEDDPLEGLNIYLAYEDYDNATKLVESVIDKYPERHEYKLRLLEIHSASKNADAFEAAAKKLQDAVGDDSPLMDSAKRWWEDLSPGRALFALGAAGAAVGAAAGAVGEAPTRGDDSIFDVTEAGDETMDISLDEIDSDGGGVDFDLGFEFESPDLEAEGDSTQGIDFELDDDTQTVSADEDESVGVDFDLGAEAEPTELPSPADTGVDFDLDFDDEALALDESEHARESSLEPSDAPADITEPPATASFTDDDLSLDFDLDDEAGAAEPTAFPAQDSSEELDFALELDDDAGAAFDEPLEPVLELDEGEQASAAEAAEDTEIEVILDLDGEPPAPPEPPIAPVSDATDEIEFALDLDATGDLSLADRDDELDFALEGDTDTPGELTGTDLDFDLGEGVESEASETGLDLDLGLGDESAEAATETGEGIETQYMLRDVPGPETSDADEPLDLSLDDGADDAAESVFLVDAPSEGEDASLDSSIVESAMDADDSLDFNLEIPESTGGGEELDINAAATQYALQEPAGDGGDSTSEVDFSLDFDEAGGDETLAPELDFDLDISGSGESANDFETVQLSADDLVDAGAIDEADDEITGTLGEQTEGIEVDGDFADIFGEAAEEPETGLEIPDSAAAADAADAFSVDGLDFDLGEEDLGLDASVGEDSSAEEDSEYLQTQYMLRDIAAITSEDTPAEEDDENRTLILGQGGGEVDEMQTKLDLAQAYIDMGDTEGARGILGEVMAEGSDEQQEKARSLLGQLN